MRHRLSAWWFVRKTRWIVLGILVFAIAVRAVLPYVVKSYVNKTLDEIPGYKGYVEDIDLNLWRGAYEIEGLRLDKVEGDIPVPFFSSPKIDLSIEWGALFRVVVWVCLLVSSWDLLLHDIIIVWICTVF